MNNKTLLENLETPTRGLIPAVDPVKDLLIKDEYDANSWYSSGSYDVDGHLINYMFHCMTVDIPQMGLVFSYRLTFTDETTGYYYDMGEKAMPVSAITLDKEKFLIDTPDGYISGDFDNMILKMSSGNNAVDITMKGMGHPLYCGGSGAFSWNKAISHQISIPHMATTGTLTLDGTTYHIEGDSWFDRQWQNNNSASLMNLKWAWMDIRLDNGDIISVWTNGDDKTENSWATIMKPDGSHTVTYADTLSDGVEEYWRSERTGRCWPTKWTVTLPDLDTKLTVSSNPYGQEIYSEGEVPGSCYEGASKVEGTYRGTPASGHCYVEITGRWEKDCLRVNATEVK